ncbi:MAG TPA: hypothetical protein VKT77_08950 [Chthonomonadaceae bacterium]|nr:hypothetical protein [Chthonomonadaceae bacterium]
MQVEDPASAAAFTSASEPPDAETVRRVETVLHGCCVRSSVRREEAEAELQAMGIAAAWSIGEILRTEYAVLHGRLNDARYVAAIAVA